MTAPLCKVSIFYNYAGRGFSETLWSSNAPTAIITPNNPTADTPLTRYLKARLLFCCNPIEAVYARCSVVGFPRRFLVQTLLNNNFTGMLSDNGAAPDDCLYMKLFGPNNELGDMHLHALPSKIVKANVLTNLGTYGNALNSFVAYLEGGKDGWVLNSGLPAPGQNRIKYPVGAMTPTLPRGFTIAKPVGATWPSLTPGMTVSISGAGADGFGYNGRKVVTTVDPLGNGFTVGGAAPVGSASLQAQFFVVSFLQATIKYAIPSELAERKTGKVFGVPAGRRRNTLSLRR